LIKPNPAPAGFFPEILTSRTCAIGAFAGTSIDIRLICLSTKDLEYGFPGNVRELESLLERAMALSNGGLIESADLHFVNTEKASVTAAQSNQALPDVIEQLERAQIQSALEACRYNKTKAAAHLGITFRALRYKMEKLGLE
jgi:DNA-binding NtrC family response regulator